MKKQMYSLGAIALISAAQAVTINVGAEGFDQPGNNWPGGEPPSAAIDGVGQKYLHFGVENTGIVVTQAGGSATATSMTLWAANDAVERDPASYQIFGTNSAVSGPSFDSSLFTLISNGSIALPADRDLGGANPLLAANSATVSFANTNSYTTYMVLFPTVKDAGAANSMQVADVQIFDAGSAGIFAPGDTILGVQSASTIPEPSTGLLSLLAATALLGRRRR
jgi:hypothetical protein